MKHHGAEASVCNTHITRNNRTLQYCTDQNNTVLSLAGPDGFRLQETVWSQLQ